MSKRFGRNQKRKLKTEVVGLQNQVSGLTKDKDWYYKNTTQYKQALDDIRGYLGSNKTKEDGHKEKHAHRVCYSHEYIGQH